jgi:hypothetical protein
MVAETTSVEASGVLAEMLRGGPLGDSLHESITKLVSCNRTEWNERQSNVPARPKRLHDDGIGLIS